MHENYGTHMTSPRGWLIRSHSKIAGGERGVGMERRSREGDLTGGVGRNSGQENGDGEWGGD